MMISILDTLIKVLLNTIRFFCGLVLVVLLGYAITAFFKPIIPVDWTFGHPIPNGRYRATWQQIYQAPTPIQTEEGTYHPPMVPLSGATLRNTKVLGTALITPYEVYDQFGHLITGANPATYQQIDFALQYDRVAAYLDAFGYDDMFIYIQGHKPIPYQHGDSVFKIYWRTMGEYFCHPEEEHSLETLSSNENDELNSPSPEE